MGPDYYPTIDDRIHHARKNIWRKNDARRRHARNEPPDMICDDCGLVDCACKNNR